MTIHDPATIADVLAEQLAVVMRTRPPIPAGVDLLIGRDASGETWPDDVAQAVARTCDELGVPAQQAYINSARDHLLETMP